MHNLHNPWNPFLPTARDVDRTETLANKSYIAVGLLAFFISPIASAMYLNRATNSLKIFGYTLALGFILLITFDVGDDNEAFEAGFGIGSIGNIVMLTEQFIAVSNACKRKSLKKETLA